MGLFDSIKRTFNIGGCSITIRTGDERFPQGAEVTGSVALRGGDYVQEARQLRIALVEFWTESRGSGKSRRTVTVTKEADSAILASPCTVAAGEERELPFSLALPLDARLSIPDQSTGWRLTVELDVPGAVDPSCRHGLEVVPATALIELVRMWNDVLRWDEVPGNRTWNRRDRTTCFRLRPPAELNCEFDFLDLACQPLPDGDWQAALVFDLQEKGLMDRLKAIINIDKARHGLRIPAAALSGDTTARAVCARELVEVMQGIIAGRAKG